LKFAKSEKGIVFITKTNKGLPIVSLSRQIGEAERLLKSESIFKVMEKYKKNGKIYMEIELLKDNAKIDTVFDIKACQYSHI
jgi:peroxiredoxin family protein